MVRSSSSVRPAATERMTCAISAPCTDLSTYAAAPASRAAAAASATHRRAVTKAAALTAVGYEEPSPIQAQAIPMILAGLPEWVAVYRELSTYPHLLDEVGHLRGRVGILRARRDGGRCWRRRSG